MLHAYAYFHLYSCTYVEVWRYVFFMLMSFYAITHVSEYVLFFPPSSLRIFYDSGFGYVQFGVEVTGDTGIARG